MVRFLVDAEALDVGQRLLDLELHAVGRGEGLGPVGGQCGAGLGAVALGGGLGDSLGPGTHGGDQAGFQRGAVDDGGQAVALQADAVEQADQRGFAHAGLEVHRLGVEGLGEFLLDAQAHAGGVAVARQVDQRGHEAPVDVRAQEERGAAAFLQAQDAQHGVGEVLHGDLEELVARVGLKDGDDVLAGVRVRGEAGALQHGLDLFAHHGHAAHRGGVDAGGEQADEAAFAVDVALGVEALDAHVVQVDAAVHGGAGVGLGDHQGALVAGHGAAALGQVLGVAGGGGVAHEAQAGLGADAQHVFVVLGDQVVVAVAQEGEVSVVEPVQQVHGGVEVRDLLGAGDKCQRIRDLVGLVAHGRPVLDGGTHVNEDAFQAGDQGFDGLVGRVPAELDGDPGFDGRVAVFRDEGGEVRQGGGVAAGQVLVGRNGFQRRDAAVLGITADHEGRVDHDVDCGLLAHDFRGHGIHQERHVVGDHINNGGASVPGDRNPC